jgi:peptidoglycan/xylan/chitin deacetylase (PgdA/CDA1 family)
MVDPGVIDGISSSIEENLGKGRYTYLNFPSIPGAAGWEAELRADVAPQLQRFTELAPGKLVPPYPELSVNWQLVGASQSAIGVRLATDELGSDQTFAGKVETSWWDPAKGSARPVQDLIRPDASVEFFSRLEAAAKAEPDIDYAKFEEQLQGEWEGVNSIAFTASGALWVEFDRSQVSQMDAPVGVVVPADGLLSPFGQDARDSAIFPRDPALRASTRPTGTSSPTQSVPSPSSPASTAGAPTSPATAPSNVNCAKLKCVALTFDDGPVTGTTQLLDLLKAKGVHATFFMVGSNVALHPALVRRMLADGNVLGNHTWDHAQLTRLDPAAMRQEITRTNAAIQKATGTAPTLLRPPYGATNPEVAKVAGQLGMAQILWNVDPLDWKDRNAAIVTKRVLASTRAGSIVLSHDIHPTSRQAYAAIIDGLRAKGFTLVTVPELLGSKLKAGGKYFAR